MGILRAKAFIHSVSVILAAMELLLAHSTFAQSRPEGQPALLVTPSEVVLPTGDTTALTAVDEAGRPAADVQWSINPQIANLQQQNGEVIVQGRESGRATLTATANHQSATAVITVVAEQRLAPATVQWSLRPMPGFQTLLVVQAPASGDRPAFYSVEWSKSENAIVRALRLSGEQMWIAHLTSSASPSTLNHTLPPAGELFEDGKLVSGDHTVSLLGEKDRVFVGNNPSNPDSLRLPAEGKSILLHAAGQADGGILLLERGRLVDSLVNLNPADGSELWRYDSRGRLSKNWTSNENMDIGIVEELSKPPSSALTVINARTGGVRFRIPFPVSSSTVDGYRCQGPHPVILKNLRPSVAGAMLTSSDGNMYVQVETHVESLLIKACEERHYSFDDNLALLRVTPEGESDWKVFERTHAEGDGAFVAQPRVLAGETIPDGFGGVLAAWTYIWPDLKIHTEARVSRIGPSGQRDFTLPMPYWDKGLDSSFALNMLLGEGNFLYAINGDLLLRLDTKSGKLNWVRHPPTGQVKLHHSTAGGGVLVSNAGRLDYFDAQGDGAPIPWTIEVSNKEDIGLVQADPLEKKPVEALQLRQLQFRDGGNFIAVEDSAPYGRGTLVYVKAN